MRDYKNLPNPDLEPEAFNQYLRDNNTVVAENRFWILIENSYIPFQLVCYSKNANKYLPDLSGLELRHLGSILSPYKTLHHYINAESDKSVANRFHIHIKL